MTTNPKAGRAVADGKAPLHYLESAVCDDGEARVLAAGAAKYGNRNYADPSTEMRWTTYLGSMRRHLNALWGGEDLDPDTGENHLFHIRANTAVLLAASAAGTLIDDRLDTEVLPASDAVHVDGELQAKADNWPPKPEVFDCVGGMLTPGMLCVFPHGTQFVNYAVEPFVVTVGCCVSGFRFDEPCLRTTSCEGPVVA